MTVHQRAPEVSDADVDRVARREFGLEQLAVVAEVLAQFDGREAPRIRLAALKVARGDLAMLRKQIDDAPGYWREIIGEAEYPRATKRLTSLGKLPDAEQRRIHDADWADYQEWLRRP